MPERKINRTLRALASAKDRIDETLTGLEELWRLGTISREDYVRARDYIRRSGERMISISHLLISLKDEHEAPG